MKYKIKVFALCFAYSAYILGLDEHTNQMFMFTRTISNSIGMQQATWHDFGFHPQKLGSSLQIYPVYAQSFENITTPEYFLFDHKKKLEIRSGLNPANFTLTPSGWTVDNPTQDNITTKSFNRDILGQWLNLTATNANDLKTSSFTVNPFQKQASGIIEFNQDLKTVSDWSLVDLWYVSLKVPVTYVVNNLGLRGDAEAISALTNNNYQYANFSQCEMSTVRASNAQLTLGTKYMNDRDAHIITGFGVSVPLSQQNNNRLLFEPLNGFNAHFGLTSLALFEFPVLRKHEHSHSRVCYFFEFENNFLSRNHQMRTYDIVDKPYSRYMKLLDRKTNSLVPAVNALTIESRVEPFNIFNMGTGFRFKYGDSVGEIGYELWAHSTEVVTPEPETKWDDSRYGIAFIDQEGDLAKINGTTIAKIDPLTEQGQTASDSTINYIGTPDGTVDCCPAPGPGLTFTQKNKYLSLRDLDIYSAAARGTITHRAYATVGFGQKGRTRDFFANLGLYIEAAQNNAALSFWGGWAKIGITF